MSDELFHFCNRQQQEIRMSWSPYHNKYYCVLTKASFATDQKVLWYCDTQKGKAYKNFYNYVSACLILQLKNRLLCEWTPLILWLLKLQLFFLIESKYFGFKMLKLKWGNHLAFLQRDAMLNELSPILFSFFLLTEQNLEKWIPD